MVQMRAIYQACLIIAECSPLKTKSVPQRVEVVIIPHSALIKFRIILDYEFKQVTSRMGPYNNRH